MMIDNSLLQSWVLCETQATMRYHFGFGLRGQSAPLLAGRAVHAALAKWLTGHLDEECLNAFDAEYHLWATDNVSPEDRLSYPNVSAIVWEFLRRNPLESMSFRVVHNEQGPLVEQLLKIPLIDGVEFAFPLDALVQDKQTGLYYVLDHKTSGNIIKPAWLSQWHLASQLTGYVYGAQKALGIPVAGAYINAIELRKLPKSNYPCAVHGVKYRECRLLHCNFQMLGPFTRSPGHVSMWLSTILPLTEQWKAHTAWLHFRQADGWNAIDQLPFLRSQGLFHYEACSNCPYQEWCRAERPLDVLDSIFVRQDPFEYLTQKESSPLDTQNESA